MKSRQPPSSWPPTMHPIMSVKSWVPTVGMSCSNATDYSVEARANGRGRLRRPLNLREKGLQGYEKRISDRNGAECSCATRAFPLLRFQRGNTRQTNPCLAPAAQAERRAGTHTRPD